MLATLWAIRRVCWIFHFLSVSLLLFTTTTTLVLSVCLSVRALVCHLYFHTNLEVNMCTHKHKNMFLEVGMCLAEESSRSGSANSTWKILAVHDIIAPSGIFEHPTIFIAPKNSSTRTTSWTSHFKKVRTCDTNTWVPCVRMILQGYVVNSIVTVGRTRK